MNGLKKILIAGTATAVAAHFAGRYWLRQRRWFEWADRTVIVTGSSRGLGPVLARQLVDRGANVVICARNANDLAQAEESLSGGWGDVLAVPCDVTKPEDVHSLVQQTLTEFGRVDILINNAGIIEVGPWESMTEDDFQRSMATHAWGVLNTTRAVAPTMKAAGWGRILNVASLGGKRAVPHMLPYAASKFAVVGLSTGLRAELAKDGIVVTTVSPGLMRTGSPRNAIFKGRHREEYTWFSIGDSLPLFSMDAEKAAEQILTACQNGDADVTITGPLNFSEVLSRLAPNWAIEGMTVLDRMLPTMGGIGRRAARGFQSQTEWTDSFLTMLSQRAARRNNEL